MLTRSLFEDTAIAHRVSLPEHQEEAIDLLQKHNDFGRLLAADSLEKHEDWLGDTFEAEDIEQLEQNRAAYQQLFGTSTPCSPTSSSSGRTRRGASASCGATTRSATG